MGAWRSQTSFTSFYLWNMTHTSPNTFSFGPVVTAQRVVDSWSGWIPVFQLQLTRWVKCMCECVSISLLEGISETVLPQSPVDMGKSYSFPIFVICLFFLVAYAHVG